MFTSLLTIFTRDDRTNKHEHIATFSFLSSARRERVGRSYRKRDSRDGIGGLVSSTGPQLVCIVLYVQFHHSVPLSPIE